MKRLTAAIALFVLSNLQVAQATELATCSSLKGHSYYPNVALNPEKGGWTPDGITGGVTTLKQLADNEFDILYIDVTKSIRSSKQEGALIRLLRKGASDMTFLVFYPGNSVEIYTFTQERSGKKTLTVLTNKGGDLAMLHRSSLMAADCDSLSLIK